MANSVDLDEAAHHELSHQDLHVSKFSFFSSPVPEVLTIKVPITTAADDIHKYLFIVFQRK